VLQCVVSHESYVECAYFAPFCAIFAYAPYAKRGNTPPHKTYIICVLQCVAVSTHDSRDSCLLCVTPLLAYGAYANTISKHTYTDTHIYIQVHKAETKGGKEQNELSGFPNCTITSPPIYKYCNRVYELEFGV